MRFKIIKAIFKKEMIDIVRDKKTLFMGIILPLLLYPILMVLMTQILAMSSDSISRQEINIAFVNEPKKEIIKILDEYSDNETSNINIIKSGNYIEDLENGTIDAYIDVNKSNVGEDYKIYINSSKSNSTIVSNKLDEIFNNYKDNLVRDTLVNAGLNEEKTLKPVVSETIDVAQSEEIAGSFLGQILPIILILGVLIGTIYPAIDSMAGEKERGTLETLFTLPITNLELVMGKYFAVSFCAIVTAIFNVISVLLTLVYLLISGGLSGMMIIGDINFSQLIIPLIITFICVSLFAMVISAVSMCVCSLAKNFKDAQNYITPVMFLVIIPSYASMVPTIELNRATSMIPVVNISLLIKDVLSFNLDITLITLVLLSNVLFVLLSLIVLSKIFNSEEILFGNNRSFSFLEKRSNIKKGTMPSISDGIILYTIALVLLIYVGSIVQLKFGMGGLVITEIMIVILPIIFAYYIKSDFKKVFKINIPKFRHLLAGFTLWLGTYLIVNLLTQIVLYIFPQNMDVIESLNNALFSENNLIIQLIVVAIFPAICEEMLFRGFILTSFTKNKKSYWVAIIISGILFGLMHLDFIRVIPTALLGISFAYAVCKSESIIVSMFMHFLNNGFAVIVTYLLSKYITQDINTAAITSPVSFINLIRLLIIGIILISISVVLFNNNDPKKKVKS